MKIQSILGSIALHSAVLVAGGTLMMTPAQYGVEEGAGGMDVDLVAAPLPEKEEAVSTGEFSEPSVPSQETLPSALEQTVAAPSPVTGDGSSAIPGQDSVTLRASSGAVMEATPKYLRNPAPHYPEAARKRGEEGLVVLLVDVDSQGKVLNVVMKQTSGYTALDESSLKTVRKWRFEPARVGSVALDSRVEVPVRFRLNES